MLDRNIDIFLISEMKLDDSFSSAQFNVSPPRTGMIETIKEVAFHCILGRTFHPDYCNVNRNEIWKVFPLRFI